MTVSTFIIEWDDEQLPTMILAIDSLKNKAYELQGKVIHKCEDWCDANGM